MQTIDGWPETERERHDTDAAARQDTRHAVIPLVLALVGCALLLLVPAWLAPRVVGEAALGIDRSILLWFHGWTGPGVDRSLRELSHLSEGTVVATLAIVGALLLWRRDRRTAMLLPAAYLGTLILHYVGKWVVGRPRPAFIDWSERLAAGSSYPSGHALTGAAFYIVLGWVLTTREPAAAGVWIWALTAFLVLASGVIRLYLGVHWPSDVLASWIVGSAWGIACIGARRRAGEAGQRSESRSALRR